MQFDGALGIAPSLLMQPVDILGDDVRQAARGLQPRQCLMAGIRLSVSQHRVSLASFLPVLPAGIRVLTKVAEGRRRIALPDASRSPVVRNARFRANARTGERANGA